MDGVLDDIWFTLDDVLTDLAAGTPLEYTYPSSKVGKLLAKEPFRFSHFANAFIASREMQGKDLAAARARAYDDLATIATGADLPDHWIWEKEHPLADESRYGPVMWEFASYMEQSGEALVKRIWPQGRKDDLVIFDNSPVN